MFHFLFLKQGETRFETRPVSAAGWAVRGVPFCGDFQPGKRLPLVTIFKPKRDPIFAFLAGCSPVVVTALHGVRQRFCAVTGSGSDHPAASPPRPQNTVPRRVLFDNKGHPRQSPARIVVYSAAKHSSSLFRYVLKRSTHLAVAKACDTLRTFSVISELQTGEHCEISAKCGKLTTLAYV